MYMYTYYGTLLCVILERTNFLCTHIHLKYLTVCDVICVNMMNMHGLLCHLYACKTLNSPKFPLLGY